MPKVKIPRKSTLIDMTAMCDVAFLLLTFFMLTTKFKTENPILVDLPTSISEIKIPERDLVQVALTYSDVNKKGRVFFSMDGQPRRTVLINYLMQRQDVPLKYSAQYDKTSSTILLSNNVPPDLKDKVVREFSLESNVDVSLARLTYWLQIPAETREQIKSQVEKDGKDVFVKYPDGKTEKFDTGLDTTVTLIEGDKKTSDLIVLTYWTRILDRKKAIESGIKGEPSKIAFRGDSKAPYSLFKKVIDALQDADELKYYFITNLEAKPQ